MTLRDALATAEHKATGQSTGSIGDPIDLCAHAFGMRACVVRADAILADPAFRAALTEAVAEACRAEWPFHREGSTTYNGYVAVTMGPEWTVLDPALPSSLDYAAIVARMLP